ncbi:MAG: magnesium transporter [Alphaproteobacteria bacterium]|nr:magnesium transporter [Alphaproteobacteria bacterium]
MRKSSYTLTLRNGNEVFFSDVLDHLRDAITQGDPVALEAVSEPIHAADLADFLEILCPEERKSFLHLRDKKFEFLVLTEVNDAVREEILSHLSTDVIARALLDLETDDAVYILENMGENERERILNCLSVSARSALTRGLDYPKKTAGRRMKTDFVAVPPSWTVGESIDHMREASGLPDDFYEIFLVDEAFRPIGTVPLSRLLRTERPVRMDFLVDKDFHKIDVLLDQEDVARTFKHYDLVSTSVVDNTGKLVGVITVDDIIDVVEEEASEDIFRLGGVGDEELSDGIADTVRARFTWLFFNLSATILVSWFISLFGGILERMIVLAVLMPIVGSMGCNAGTQTMTVVVRALSMGNFMNFNTKRVLIRESVASFLNGCIFALISGLIVSLWSADVQLGFLIGFAVIVSFSVAGFLGVLIPLGVHRIGFDPAVASGTFVMTLIDVIGLFTFLGLGAWWFHLA